MKTKFFIIFIVFIFGIGYLIFFTNSSLSGHFITESLVDYHFDELGIDFLAPDDLVLFDVSHSSNLHEDIEKYLIIEGGGAGGFPQIKIYRFPNGIYGEETDTTNTIVNIDIERINNQYNYQTLEIANNNSVNNLTFTYLTNIIIFQKADKEILCKDWIGEKENYMLLVSICATEKQWIQLDNVYEDIILSIE